MNRAPVENRRARLPYISRFQPGCNSLAAYYVLTRLREAHGMKDEADYRPQHDQFQTHVGPREQERSNEDHHVWVAPRRDEPEFAVDRLPHMDVHAAEAPHEDPFYDPLRDVAADDRPEHHRRIDGFKRSTVSGEPMLPRPPPEGRVDEVDPVIEHIAPFRRGAGATRELSVDRI